MRHKAVLPLLTLIGAASVTPAALAQPAPPPERIMNLTVYGDDPCPKSEGNEIVVCARRPESERYRIPKKLREKPEAVGGPGWGSQVATMEQTQRQVLPNSCSPNGSYGFSGCAAQALAQWFAERRMMQSQGNP